MVLSTTSTMFWATPELSFFVTFGLRPLRLLYVRSGSSCLTTLGKCFLLRLKRKVEGAPALALSSPFFCGAGVSTLPMSMVFEFVPAAVSLAGVTSDAATADVAAADDEDVDDVDADLAAADARRLCRSCVLSPRSFDICAGVRPRSAMLFGLFLPGCLGQTCWRGGRVGEGMAGPEARIRALRGRWAGALWRGAVW